MKKLILIAAIISAGLIWFMPNLTRTSYGFGGLLPFGGRIAFVRYCCNGVAITVGPPRPGTFLFMAGSRLHSFYNIFTPGPYVLGTAFPGGVCFELASFPPCVRTTPVQGIIHLVGTSAF